MKILPGVIAFSVILSGAAPHIGGQTESSTTEQLAALGRVWNLVKYGHPRVALGSVDWDAPVLAAIEATTKGADDAEFVVIVGDMLAALRDPLTRTVAERNRNLSVPIPSGPAVRIRRGIPIVSAAGMTTADGVLKDFNSNAEAASAASLVIDLRVAAQGAATTGAVSNVLTHLTVAEPTPLPSRRHAIVTPFERYMALSTVATAQPPRGAKQRRTVFVIGPTSIVPPIVLSLVHSDQVGAILVGEMPATGERVRTLRIAAGHQAQVRVEEFVVQGRAVRLEVQRSLSADSTDDQVFAAAEEILQQGFKAAATQPDLPPVMPPEANYSDNRFPSEAHRILSVFRLWGAVEHFFAYKHLMDSPWASALDEFVPKVRAAASELEYAKVIAMMGARLQDSHVAVVNSPALRDWYSGEPQGAQIREIEGKPIVVRLRSNNTGEFQIGDEILAIDGETVDAKFARIEPYLSFSTPWARRRLLTTLLLPGPPGSRSTVRVRRDDAVLDVRTAERSAAFRGEPERDGEVVRVLDANIGYVDLDRLQQGEVDPMFQRLKDTRAIIFDIRGYPLETGRLLYQRLNLNGEVLAAQFYSPRVEAGVPGTLHNVQYVPPAASPIYDKPIIILIDERAQSQAEHLVLSLKAANRPVLIGSPTAGANGVTTIVTLPGGLGLRFTADDTRLADGTQLQRRGLHPDIEARPTVGGIKAGRDEVIDRAVAYVISGR